MKNALKFTRSGHIQIKTYFNYVEETLIVQVRDSGCGIAPDNLQKLFKRFGKLRDEESLAMNQEGIGLGLIICKEIISQNGGRIEVYSKGVNQGTTFIFSMKMRTIPADEVEQRTA